MMTNKRIVELRKKLGLNQADFAGRLGIKRSTVANIETDRNPLTEANIKLICHVFNVNEEWLRAGDGEMFQNSKSHLEGEVLEMFRGLSEKARLMIRDYIRMVLEQQEALRAAFSTPPPAKEDARRKPRPELTLDRAPEYPADIPRRDLPVVGITAAGVEREAVYMSDEFASVPESLLKGDPADYYCIRVKGMSMYYSGVYDGDIALIRKADAPEYGKINLVYHQNQTLLKRLELKGGTTLLRWNDGSGQSVSVASDEYQVQGVFVAVVNRDGRDF
jgi:SOS-response transcriptional repressor LexA